MLSFIEIYCKTNEFSVHDLNFLMLAFMADIGLNQVMIVFFYVCLGIVIVVIYDKFGS